MAITRKVIQAGLMAGAVMIGCGDDDGAVPDAGGGGSGGGRDMDAATAAPATRVGDPCNATSDCDGPKPVCLHEIDPNAPFAGNALVLEEFLGGEVPGSGSDVDAGSPNATLETPGGYCSSQGCTLDEQCGEGAACYNVTTLLRAVGAARGNVGGLIGFGGLAPIVRPFLRYEDGYCLQTCEHSTDCSRAGYECRSLFDLSTFVDSDAGASPHDGGVAAQDRGAELPTYCVPELPDDGADASTE